MHDTKYVASFSSRVAKLQTKAEFLTKALLPSDLSKTIYCVYFSGIYNTRFLTGKQCVWKAWLDLLTDEQGPMTLLSLLAGNRPFYCFSVITILIALYYLKATNDSSWKNVTWLTDAETNITELV
jgi:hypothetical protein